MISFEFHSVRNEIEIFDTIARHRYLITLAGRLNTKQVSPSEFSFPVDAVLSTNTSSIVLQSLPPILVRSEEGELITSVREISNIALPASVYFLEICTPIKFYIRVESEVTLSVDPDSRTHIEFGEETEALIGARSKHEQPAGTIVVPDEPEAMFAAISTFGSALKTTSPERSYPNLRGHPPLIERGSCLDIPDELTPPDTGVRLELPATYRRAYVAAPLAYYLGADLAATDSLDDEPQLVTDTGFTHVLSSPQGFERECERVLKQVFFLDCLTRTEGTYDLDLYELRVLSDILDLNFERLFYAPISKQIESYLEISFDDIQPYTPDWKLTSYVAPTHYSSEVIPFLAKDLAVLRTPHENEVDVSRNKIAAINDFVRNTLNRGTNEPSFNLVNSVQSEQDKSLEQVWVGEGIMYGASKALPAAYQNRLNRSPSVGQIDIAVVCNDTTMSREKDIVASVYGSRENLHFEVDAYRNLTVDELESVLSTQVDFLHYIGHIDDGGFECSDGKLDAGTLDTVEVDAFFLNACESYEQGKHLINLGSIAGIATLYSVVNSGATAIGATIARLLNCGFPLRTALEIAKTETTVGYHYLVLGDGGLSITQAESSVPILCNIEPTKDKFNVSMTAFASSLEGMGSVITPFIDGIDEYYLTPGSTPTFTVTQQQLEKFLKLEDVPIKLHGSLHWSSELDLDALERTAALNAHQNHK